MIHNAHTACNHTPAFRVPFFSAAAVFLLLCTYRVKLLLSCSDPMLALLFLLFLSLFLLVHKQVTQKGVHCELCFLTLTAALFVTFSFSLYQISAQKSLLWLLLYGASAYFLFSSLPMMLSRQVALAALLLGLVYAVFLFLGAQLEQFGRLELLYLRTDPLPLLRLFLSFAGQWLLFSAILCRLFSALLKSTQKKETPCPDISTPLRITLMTLGILLCWLPYFYAFYPGNLSPDSVMELHQQMGLLPLSNHHPYLHQLFLRLCLTLGGSNITLGIAIYTFLQMLLLTLSFSLCISFLSGLGVSRQLCLCVYCFFALFSVNAFYSVTVWKDVLHGCVTLLFMMLLVLESQSTKQAAAHQSRLLRAVASIVLAFLFCTLRNNGWYAFLLGFPLFILANRRHWKRLLLLFLCTVISISAYNHLLFQVLHIQKSSTGEALSVPMQQIARVANQNPDACESEEYHILSELFEHPRQLGELYRSYLSDPVKNEFRAEVFNASPLRYVKSWAALGLDNPTLYIEAFLLQCYGYWYPDVDYWIIHNSLEDNEAKLTHHPDRIGLRFELSLLSRDLSSKLPTAILYSLGLMVWLLLFSAVLLILKGHGKCASPLWIQFMFWLTTLASPVYCEYRYLYGLVVSVPLFFALALGLQAKEEVVAFQ